jgi:tetratricopeptide (TPR) repeat protein
MALSGPVTSPIRAIGEAAAQRAIAQEGGVVVVVDPQSEDVSGLQRLGKVLSHADHKPTVIVVARNYNPFTFGTAMAGLKVEHQKARAKLWLRDLPAPPDEEALPALDMVPKKSARARSGENAPQMVYVGREEETEKLKGMIKEGGPVVVSGAPGVGKTWLTERAIAAAECEAYPEVVLGRGSAADTLLAMLATITSANGSDVLAQKLKGEHTTLEIFPAVVEALQAAEAAEGKVLVVRNLHYGLSREGDFFRRSRLELLLEALLISTYSLSIVFLSDRAPRFHREGQASVYQGLALEGLKGKEMFDLFESYKAPEFKRGKMGAVADKIHGHPLAARMYAVALRTHKDGVELLEDPKFLKMKAVDHVEPVQRKIKAAIERLTEESTSTLSRLAHLRSPVEGTLLADLGVSRKVRLGLLTAGLLDMVPCPNERRYRVHPMVRRQLSRRQVSDFETHRRVSDVYEKLASRATDPVQKLAYQQESIYHSLSARTKPDNTDVGYPNFDMWIDSATGMLRGREPMVSKAEQRVTEVLAADASNSDAWLLLLECIQKGDAKFDAYEAKSKEAFEKAAVPELCQQVATFWLQRRQRNRAQVYLEKGVEMMPGESRLRTRLASMMMRQGRRPEALEHLRMAMDLDPMLPDAYGLLGQARRDEGGPALQEAEQLLREAVRLAPGDPVQVSRLCGLLLDRSRVDEEVSEALREEAGELLREVLKGKPRAPECYLQLSTLLREDGGDLEQASWLLDKAKKMTDRQNPRHVRIRVAAALLKMAEGDLDGAEKSLRDQVQRDPTAHGAFAGLGHVLEAREMYVPAHAEYQRAKERCSQSSLACDAYNLHLLRVQKLIEMQAAGLLPARTEPVVEAPAPAPAAAEAKVKKRRGKSVKRDDEDEAAEVAPEATAVAEAVAEAPAEVAEAEAVEVEADPAEVTEAEAVEVEAAPADVAEAEAVEVEAAPAEVVEEPAEVVEEPAEAAAEEATPESDA